MAAAIDLAALPFPHTIGLPHLSSDLTNCKNIPLLCVDDLKEPTGRETAMFDFFEFPQYFSWKFAKDGKLLEAPITNTDDPTYETEFGRIIQRWLFFELLREVFGFLPGFQYAHFYYDENQKRYISTEHLPTYLSKWNSHENATSNKQEQRRRFAHVQRVLSHARHLIFQHCSVNHADGEQNWPINDLVSLSLMIVGETLTRAHIMIQKCSNFTLTGWHDHEYRNQGWGCSRYALGQLKEKWCPKAIAMLQALMRNNSIGLIYLAALPMRVDMGKHRECSYNRCCVESPLPNKSKMIQSITLTLHHSSRCQKNHCHEITVPSSDTAKVIEDGDIPLLRYHSNRTNDRALELVRWQKNTTPPGYHVFSHVWSDHFGDPDQNKINSCMLTEFEIIFNDIKKKKPDYAASNRAQAGSELFWIDTLLIPNAEEYRVPRTETIQKMHKIYYHAKNTIVLDNSLMEESIGTCYAEPAIKITMSAWMRRLWTLQEAVFSKSIWFIFKEGAFHMDDLEKLYREENKSLHSGLTEVSRAYHNGILGDMRQGLLEQGDKYKVNTAFVAATWKAAQWRTTAQDQHETLALAILFQLDVDEFVGYIPTDPVTGLVPQDELDNRMRSFLQQLCDNRKLLPGGMIFLPGASLTGEGYGWAPRTWLSAHDVDSPDPLELSVEKPAKFQVRVGLTAKYPGFMLHSVDQKKSLLSQYKFIKFPVHHSLTEWYQLEVAESEYFPKEIDDQTKELAIINPRLPLVNVKEIALLVAIQRKPNEDFDVHVLCRVWTSRVHDPDTIDELIRKYKDRDTSIKFLGEQLRERKWTVDRAPPSPPAPSPPPPFPPHIVGSSATSEEKFEAPKLKRRTQTLIDFTNGFGNIPGRLLRLIRHSKTDETV